MYKSVSGEYPLFFLSSFSTYPRESATIEHIACSVLSFICSRIKKGEGQRVKNTFLFIIMNQESEKCHTKFSCLFFSELSKMSSSLAPPRGLRGLGLLNLLQVTILYCACLYALA
jgi:hypothetical protein